MRRLALLLSIIFFVSTAYGQRDKSSIPNAEKYEQLIRQIYQEPLGTFELSIFSKSRGDAERGCHLYEKYFVANLISKKKEKFCDIHSENLLSTQGFFRFPYMDAMELAELLEQNNKLTYTVRPAEKFGSLVAVPVELLKTNIVYYFFDPRGIDKDKNQTTKIINVLVFNQWPLDMIEANDNCRVQYSHYSFAIKPKIRDFYLAIPEPCGTLEWNRR